MLVVVPMAGSGQRFVDAGYKAPKPLIEIEGHRDRRMIIEHVLEMFQDPRDRFIFICNEAHARNGIIHKLLELKPDSIVIPMPPHKKGPSFTVVPAFPYIGDEEEVVIAYCDGTIQWDRSAFRRHVDHNWFDACILTHTGFHPHVLNSTKMAFLKADGDVVTEIKEKASYTDDPMGEHASSGVYYFRRGADVKKYLNRQIDRDLNYNGEYYITLAYNLLIEDGLKVGYFDTEHVAVLGTPEEVKNFEAWSVITRGAQVRTPEDLLKVFNYWKRYHAFSL